MIKLRKDTITSCVSIAISFSVLHFTSVCRADVVINEILYHAPDDLEDLEYVELLNAGPERVDLSGWKLTKGVKYSFPKGASIDTGKLIVIAKDADLLKEYYGVTAIGEYTKSLSNKSDEVRLSNSIGEKVESVEYADEAPWPKSADGYSASLERICPNGKPNDPANWSPSVLSGDYDTKPSGSPGQPNSVAAKAAPPSIESVTWRPKHAAPGTPIKVIVRIKNSKAIETVQLHHRLIAPGAASDVTSVQMKKLANGDFGAAIPTSSETNRLLRFKIEAEDAKGGVALSPKQNDLRPEYTVYVGDGETGDRIPVIQFFHVGKSQFESGEQYVNEQTQPARRGFGRGFEFGGPREEDPDERLRRETESRLRSVTLDSVWTELTLGADRTPKELLSLATEFKSAQKKLDSLREEARRSTSIEEFSKGLSRRVEAIRNNLRSAVLPLLSSEDLDAFAQLKLQDSQDRRRGFGRDPAEMIKRIVRVERSWLETATGSRIDEAKIAALAEVHREFVEKRDSIKIDLENFDPRELFETARSIDQELKTAIAKIIAPAGAERTAEFERIRFGGPERRGGPAGRGGPGGGRGPGGRRSPFASYPATPLHPQGDSAIIYTNPQTGETDVYDFINITRRKSGWKVRFHKDRPFLDMTTINFLYESDEATILNESLAYELYRSAGNASYSSGYMRVHINGKLAGYHLYFEQPNGNFFRRNDIDDDGDLYKLIWMGTAEVSERIPVDKRPRRDIAGRYEKKSNRHDDYQDLENLIVKLERVKSDDETWQLIKENFEVDQVINYFAVNSLLSHWDGFFNNYFAYFDRKGTGKWSMLPWDQDSTWSQRGGRAEELHEMPIFFGAAGATPDGLVEPAETDNSRRGRFGFGRGFGRGFGWWRDGGDFSRPLLANPEFYQRFKRRLNELTETVFTVESFGPKIESLATSLEPEVRLRAKLRGADEDDAIAELHRIKESLIQHLTERRSFVRQQIRKNSDSLN